MNISECSSMHPNGRQVIDRGPTVLSVDRRADSSVYQIWSKRKLNLISTAIVYDNVWNPGSPLDLSCECQTDYHEHPTGACPTEARWSCTLFGVTRRLCTSCLALTEKHVGRPDYKPLRLASQGAPHDLGARMPQRKRPEDLLGQ